MPHSFRYKKNKFTKLLVLPLLVIIVLLLGYIKYNSNVYSPVDPDDNTSISFQIKKGQTIKEIAKNLKEKNLIKSPSAFYWYAKFNNLGQDVIAGRFILNKTMNTPKQFLKNWMYLLRVTFIRTHIFSIRKILSRKI